MTTTRRQLMLVGAGVLCGSALGGAGCGGAVDGGNVADYVEGDLKKAADGAVLIGRDAAGFYALTAVCTHALCDLTDEGGVIADGEIRCGAPCGHGSVFDANGAVVAGPAGAPLKHLKLTVDPATGAISVDSGSEVPVEERVFIE